jgi:hypothetical protein
MNHLKTYVVDRYEGEYAVLIDGFGKAYDVLRDELPVDTREGDVMNENDGVYVFDEESTKEKREKIQKIKETMTKSNI